MKKTLCACVVCLLLGVLLLPVMAQEEAKTQLPAADKVLEEFIKAAGGKAAFDRITNRYAESRMDIPAQGLSLDFKMYQAKPNKVYMVINSDITGKIENGCDGDTVWELSAMRGPQIKEGEERAAALHFNMMDRFVYYKTAFKSVKTTDKKDVDGATCYVVEAVPESGALQTLYFDADSHLLVKMDTEIKNPMGVIPVSSTLSDYKAIDGVKIPHKTVMTMMGQERVITTTKTENNVDIPAGTFDLPEEIKQLKQKAQTKDTEPKTPVEEPAEKATPEQEEPAQEKPAEH